MKPLLVLWLALCAFPPAVLSKSLDITAFIGQTTENGYIDAGMNDSVEDLAKAMKRKGFTIVQDQESADVVAIVTGRYTGSQIIGSQTSVNRGLFGGIYASNTPIVEKMRYVFVQFSSGDFKKEWHGYGGLWKNCTTALAREFRKWVDVNKEAVIKNRSLRDQASRE